MGNLYEFHARDPNGKLLKGSIESYSEQELIRKLQNSGYTVTNIKEKEDRHFYVKKIPYKELAFFCRQLGSMVRTGIPIIKALRMVEAQIRHKKLRTIIHLVINDLLNGEYLASSFKKHQRYFPPLFINMLYSSEESGELDHVLTLLADNFQELHQVKGKIRSAFIYPSVVIIFAMFVSFALIVYALPTFLTLFENSNVELPIITQILLTIHNLIMNDGILLLLFLTFFLVAGMKILQNEHVKKWIDYYIIKVPYFGNFVNGFMVYQFSQSLHDLYKSGIPIDQSLEITSKIVKNKFFSEAIKDVCREIRLGVEFGTALENSGIFPSILVSIVKVGEESGDLDDLLEELSVYTKNELTIKIQQMTSLLEPFLLIIVGLLVGSIVIGIMLPMYDGMTLINK